MIQELEKVFRDLLSPSVPYQRDYLDDKLPTENVRLYIQSGDTAKNMLRSQYTQLQGKLAGDRSKDFYEGYLAGCATTVGKLIESSQSNPQFGTYLQALAGNLVIIGSLVAPIVMLNRHNEKPKEDKAQAGCH